MGDARYVSLGYPSPGSMRRTRSFETCACPRVELLKRFPSSSLKFSTRSSARPVCDARECRVDVAMRSPLARALQSPIASDSRASRRQLEAPLHLAQAIMANSPPLVTRLLDAGADATRAPGMEETHWFSSTAEGSGFEAMMGQVTLVHFAVLNGYLVVGKHPADTARHEDALTILSTLIERGADVHARATFASAVCYEHNAPSTAPSTAEPALQTDIDGLSPSSFARLLAVQLEMQTVHSPVHRQAGDSQVAWLEAAIARLSAAERAAAEGHTTSAPGSPSVHAFLAAFSTQCDVRFVCSADGTTLHAHQAVLAAASDHFRALFSEARAASSGASPRSPDAGSHVVARVEMTSSKWEKAAVRVQAWIRGHQAS